LRSNFDPRARAERGENNAEIIMRRRATAKGAEAAQQIELLLSGSRQIQPIILLSRVFYLPSRCFWRGGRATRGLPLEVAKQSEPFGSSGEFPGFLMTSRV
jgi:hypothetical protein